jgi:hypothetical protein
MREGDYVMPVPTPVLGASLSHCASANKVAQDCAVASTNIAVLSGTSHNGKGSGEVCASNEVGSKLTCSNDSNTQLYRSSESRLFRIA